jgi:peroxiredoxin
MSVGAVRVPSSGEPGVGDRAPNARLLDLSGNEVMLSSSWQDGPGVLVFLRYFGCPFCQAQVVGLRDDRDRFADLGARPILIGQGTIEQGAAFVDSKHLPFACLIDPARSAYRAFGLGTGSLMQVFGPKVAGPFLTTGLRPETRQRGLRGGKFMQMPGTVVVDARGVIRFAHRNRTVADSPSNELILGVLADLERQGS